MLIRLLVTSHHVTLNSSALLSNLMTWVRDWEWHSSGEGED